MPDYSHGLNLNWTRINKDVYVSTAAFAQIDTQFPGGLIIETWVFRDDGKPSIQVFHNSINKAVKVHRYIVNNLKNTLNP